MRVSPTGWVALYQTAEQREAKRPGSKRNVVRWDDEGRALVVDERHGELVPAAILADFKGLMETEYPIVGALPAVGWKLGYAQDDGEPEVVDNLVGWAVHADGYLSPIVAGEGVQGEPMFESSVGNEMRLIPPAVVESTS